jgi:hypothetical protein
MEGHILEPGSGKLMRRVDTLVNIPDTGRKFMKNICSEMHTVGANMNMHTMTGRVEHLAQNVI